MASSTPIPQQVAPGFRFLKDLYPESRGVGLSYYPYSSIISGLVPTTTIAADSSVASTVHSISISSGSAYLDSQIATLSATATNAINITPTTTLHSGGSVVESPGTYYYYIIANPSRRVLPYIGTVQPTKLLNGDDVANGDWAIQCFDMDEYLQTSKFYKRVSGAWSLTDPIFENPIVPSQKGNNRGWGNQTSSKLAAGNFKVNQAEQLVYVSGVYPPYTNSNSLSLIRNCASLQLGTLTLVFKPATESISNVVATDGVFSSTLSSTDSKLINGLRVQLSYDGSTENTTFPRGFYYIVGTAGTTTRTFKLSRTKDGDAISGAVTLPSGTAIQQVAVISNLDSNLSITNQYTNP